MEISVLNKKENNLIGRLEVTAEVSYTGATPSNDNIQKEFAKSLSADASLIVVKHIYSQFGAQKANVTIFSYKDKKTLEEFEEIKPVSNSKPADKETPAETATPDKKESAPKSEEKQSGEEKKEVPAASEAESKPVEAKAEQ